MSDEREIELLRQLAERDAQLAGLSAQLAQAKIEITLLQQKLDALARRLFGKKSEQLSPEQLQLLFEEFNASGPALGKEDGPQSSEALFARPRNRIPRINPYREHPRITQ